MEKNWRHRGAKPFFSMLLPRTLNFPQPQFEYSLASLARLVRIRSHARTLALWLRHSLPVSKNGKAISSFTIRFARSLRSLTILEMFSFVVILLQP